MDIKLHHWFNSYSYFPEQGTLPIGGVALGRVCNLQGYLI